MIVVVMNWGGLGDLTGGGKLPIHLYAVTKVNEITVAYVHLSFVPLTRGRTFKSLPLAESVNHH